MYISYFVLEVTDKQRVKVKHVSDNVWVIEAWSNVRCLAIKNVTSVGEAITFLHPIFNWDVDTCELATEMLSDFLE